MNADIPKIRLRGLTRTFGALRALDNIDLDVATGESLALIGPSASGKTLLLKCLLGLIKPTAGSVEIDGVDTVKLRSAERMAFMSRFGMLFQQSALFDSIPVWENVAFRLNQDPALTDEQAHDIAIEKLARVGLQAEVGALLPAELSGGMQKRVGLARAFAADPEIVLLDEPTAGLDPIMTNVIDDLILENARELGATVVSITSNMVSARRISDRIAMLHEGRLVWTGPTADIDNSDNPYLDQFIHKRGEGPIKMAVTAA